MATFQFSTTLRTNRVGQIQATVGGSGVVKFFSGALPANCAAADPAGLLATLALPATFLTSAGGAATIAGTWQTTGSSPGTIACFRMYDGGAVCHQQGDVTATGGGGAITVDNTSITSGQTLTVTGYTVTDGNS